MIIDYSRDQLLTRYGQATLADRYLLPGEGPQDLFARVAKAYADDENHAQRLYDYMSQHWFMPATPILSNGGTDRGLPISCFLNEADDDMQGIVDNWVENVWLACRGGGIGTYWGNIRSIGEAVGAVGKTSGVVPFIKVQDALTLAISQGSLRRGSAAVYLPVDHPEIEEFIEIRRPTGGDPNRKALNLHHGVTIPDAFMEAVEKGTKWQLRSPKTGQVIRKVEARALWARLLTARIETGEPYMIFIDTVNRDRPIWHQEMGLDVVMSNLCVAPETKILTKDGYQTISKLKDQKVAVWNGEEWSEVTVRQTGRNQRLLKVTFSDGSTLECTPEHKFYVQEGYNRSAVVREVRAKDLLPNQKLIKLSLPADIEHGEQQFPRAYMHGFFCGDGTYTKGNKPLLHLYGEKKELVVPLSSDGVLKGSGIEQPSSDRLSFLLPHDLAPKFQVPGIEHSIQSKLAWLAGLLDADGNVVRNGETFGVHLASINSEFLQEVRYLLHTLGVQPKITVLHEARKAALPNGNGGTAFFNCQPINRMIITAHDTKHLLDLGMRCHRLDFSGMDNPNRDARQFVRVVSVEDEGRIDDTYCFTEPKRHMGVFNGLLTGQCTEITLPTSKDRTAVCCLSSLNLETIDQWWLHPLFIGDVMRFLDNVLTDFINKAPESHRKAAMSAMAERSVGLGVMGWHSLLQQRMIPFDSPKAADLNRYIFAQIQHLVDRANQELAVEKGSCPDAASRGYIARFSNCTSIAPTASISGIAGEASPGIEPWMANVFTQKTLSGSFTLRNRYLAEQLDACGRNTSEVWASIAANGGSVQHLDFLTHQQKEVFRTALEIDQMAIINQAGDRQQYIDQSQSVNLFVPANCSKAYLHRLHMNAWKRGLKSLYYLRSQSIQRADAISTDAECIACQ